MSIYLEITINSFLFFDRAFELLWLTNIMTKIFSWLSLFFKREHWLRPSFLYYYLFWECSNHRYLLMSCFLLGFRSVHTSYVDQYQWLLLVLILMSSIPNQLFFNRFKAYLDKLRMLVQLSPIMIKYTLIILSTLSSLIAPGVTLQFFRFLHS